MSHPYRGLSARHYWSQSVAAPGLHEVDPVSGPGLALTPDDRVATMGSCFAQHLSRHLEASGMNYYVPEPGPETLTPLQRVEYGYGVFSARYGNVYTARQGLQLVRRAFGEWESSEAAWQRGGAFVDPFRPQVQPNGFPSVAALQEDRDAHLAAVRDLVTNTSVLVFTLGLTETWTSIDDGTVLPIVPGASGGTFDHDRYRFRNFSISETIQDIEDLMASLVVRNPTIRILLTVSPVPLIATYSSNHVLAATTYSKSVLRVAAEVATESHANTHYFPSFEIITGLHAGNHYYEPDLRSVSPRGVNHVMRLFNAHHVAGSDGGSNADHYARVADEIRGSRLIVCDEEILEAE